MCIIAAKYCKTHGWVLVKNRDQDYVADISFLDEDNPKVGEILTLYDHHTKYKEGMNYLGMVIISTSLTPLPTIETDKKDGDCIRKALEFTNPEDAARYLIREEMTGCIFVATKDKLLLIEGAREDQGKGDYKYKIKKFPKTETVVRTNHGVLVPWAGFQYGINDRQNTSRKSSILRMKYAEEALKNTNSPIEMLDAFASRMDNDLQMNLFRVENKPRQMRTIFQWALVPSEDLVYIRPIQTLLKIKVDVEMIGVKILDNEYIKKLYHGKIKHFTKIVKKDGYVKTVQLESFRDYYESKRSTRNIQSL